MLHSSDTATKAELLKNVGLFSDCSKGEIRRVAEMSREERVASGTVIVEEGTVGDRFFVLAEGLADVSVEGSKVGSITPGSFFGEMALIEHEVRSATVTAELPCRLLVVHQSDFPAVRSIPSVSQKVLEGMSKRLRRANHPVSEGA